MPADRNSQYPYHLMKLVGARLAEHGLEPPPNRVLLRLFETLYFASLKTDENRPCLCTVNFLDPGAELAAAHQEHGNWVTIPFDSPLPLDTRTLTKLADAADPSVSSLAVFPDESGSLFVWGMVDQELRYGDYVSLDSDAGPRRPGMFQASINGVGSICVYKDYQLLGSLEQNTLVKQYHDVLWKGPVHEMLRTNLRNTLFARDGLSEALPRRVTSGVEDEFFVRWQNAICRILMNIQQYRHGGGLLIAPRCPVRDVHVKYRVNYDRLPKALLGLVQHQLLRRQAAMSIAQYCGDEQNDSVPCSIHFDAMRYHDKLHEHKNEALGSVRFIASLSRVDGVVLLDKSLVVHGFGVELRPKSDLSEICVAGDPEARPRLLRTSSLSHFGTRHRAMIRYCSEHDGALGFVISQDGDVRAITQVNGQVVLWENINVQLAFKTENRAAPNKSVDIVGRIFQFWSQSLNCLASSDVA